MASDYVIKRNKKVGIKNGVTWGTAVKPVANDGFFVEELGHPHGQRLTANNADEAGRGMAQQGITYNYLPQSGTLDMKAYVEGIGYFFARVFGAEAVSGASAPYTKTYTWDKTLTGLFSTIGWLEGTQIKAIPSAVLSSLKLSVDNALKLSVDYTGGKVEDVTSSWTDLSTLTYPSDGKDVFKLLNLTFLMADYDESTPLDSGDVIKLTNINVEYNRGYNVNPALESGNDTIGEPIEEEAPNIAVNLEMRTKDATNNGLFADHIAGTYKMLKATFTVGTYVLTLYFPKMYIENIEYAFGSPTQVSVQLQAVESDANAAGMTGSFIPYVTIENGLNTTHLS